MRKKGMPTQEREVDNWKKKKTSKMLKIAIL